METALCICCGKECPIYELKERLWVPVQDNGCDAWLCPDCQTEETAMDGASS